MTVREIVSSAIGFELKALAKARGFKKSALKFARDHGATFQVFELQLSHGNSSTSGAFYVNVGISFAAVTALKGETTGQLMIGGQSVHFGARLEKIVAVAPASWEVTVHTEPEELGRNLVVRLRPMLEMFDRVDSPETMLEEPALERDLILRAQLRLITGDAKGALSDVKQVADALADRPGITVEWLLRQHGLKQLL
jgi:hypothetical protein